MESVQTRPIQLRRRGYTLLEVVVASAITLATLVSSMELLRDGIELSRDIDDRLLLANYATQLLESQMPIVAASWTSGTLSGDLASDGYASLRYIVTRSDAVVDGGLPDQLMHIHVLTYIDANDDDALTTGEVQCEFSTKIGKLATYEAVANP